MIVIKFGGSSVANAINILKVKNIINDYLKKDSDLIVVCSAFHGVTDLLLLTSNLASHKNTSFQSHFLQICERHTEAIEVLFENADSQFIKTKIQEELDELECILKGIYYLGELSKRSLDLILGFGERLSTQIISSYLKSQHLPNEFIDARDLILTNDQFGSAMVLFESTNQNIARYINSSKQNTHLWLVTGFIASTQEGYPTTLGRGGSDYTASIFGAALNAKEIHIWTDVNGVLTADPRKVSKAFSIEELTYEEAMEMSNLGAKVIYPPTVFPAYKKQIPLRIKNTFNPDFEGTYIGKSISSTKLPVKGVTSLSGVVLLTIRSQGMTEVQDLNSRLFRRLSESGIPLILIIQGTASHTITFALLEQYSFLSKKVVHQEFALEFQNGLMDLIEEESNLCLLSVIGEKMRHMPGISGRFLSALGRNGVNVRAISQGSSELAISVAIAEQDHAKALNATHEIFFLSDTITLHLFLIGLGNVGGTLLKIMEQEYEYLKKKKSVEIKMVGLAKSDKMIFDQGLDSEFNLLNKGKEIVLTKGTPMNKNHFIDEMIKLNLPNSIFIDCTADGTLPDTYEKVLNASISIVTPNKAANAESLERYLQIKQTQKLRGIGYRYETTVGAGLPIINTLNDLLESGDKILKVEAILSGSLSFILNQMNEGMALSECISEAMLKGYTEPDPRIDLSGMDFARKLVILCREMGIPMELKEVEIDPIVGAHYFNKGSVSDFLKAIEMENESFRKKIEKAKNDQKLIRYIGVIKNGKASIRWEEIGMSHPFYNLSGSDNIISFTTLRYHDRPLVVKGPGAGAEVTAAGVFSEIISLSSQNKIWGKL